MPQNTTGQLLVTPEQLVSLYQCPFVRAATFAAPLNSAMWNSAIVTPERIRAFLAQVGHESGRLRWVREIWGPTTQQLKYERDFGGAWPPSKEDKRNKVAYDLGNVEQGDGHRFMGRGLIQVTGRTNYELLSNSLDVDLVASPALLERPDYACLSAAQFWFDNELNQYADECNLDAITRKINGGQTGRASRWDLYDRAMKVIV